MHIRYLYLRNIENAAMKTVSDVKQDQMKEFMLSHSIYL